MSRLAMAINQRGEGLEKIIRAIIDDYERYYI
jgi:hypothetical protein